jgi:predicted peroxiredoxin
MKALQIVESAYRGTIEEQDDTIIWLSHAMKGAGADLTVALRGNAVNYAVKGQSAAGLAFGEWQQTQAPDIEHDLTSLMGKGVKIYVMEADLASRGISRDKVVDGVDLLSFDDFVDLIEESDRIWHW